MKNIAKALLNLTRSQKLFIVIFSDFFCMILVWAIFGPPLSTLMTQGFGNKVLDIIFDEVYQVIIPAIISLLFLFLAGFYKTMIRFYDTLDTIFIALTGSFIYGFSWLITYLLSLPVFLHEYFFVFLLQAFMLSIVLYSFLSSIRIFAKYILFTLKASDINAEPIIIYGAGSAGKELYEALQFDKSKKIIGFFDDSDELSNRIINNIPIYTKFSKLKSLRSSYANLSVLLAIPSLNLHKRRELITKLEKLRIAVRTVPAFHELVFDSKKMSDIQNLSINDILPNRIIDRLVIKNFAQREILVSGGGGSIGSEIVRQLIASSVGKIYVIDNFEFNLFKIYEETKAILKNTNAQIEIIPILGDIKDRKFLKRIFKKHSIDTIFHAAAYKHVPLIEIEENISSALENNFLGTFTFAEEAAQAGINSFVLVSTDKAVRPTNVMGASKRLAELSIQALNGKYQQSRLSMVRFGNVINSSGSVIPTFLEQIAAGGPLTITHKEVERYFMTIPEASNLVIQAGELSNGGEVFILDMGEQMKVIDIAKRLIHLSGRSIAEGDDENGIKIIEIGLRQGEKMYEELLISGNEKETVNKKIFKSNESHISYEELLELKYEMSNNVEKNNITEIKKLLRKYVDGYPDED
tara:strand:- start:3706 stop:5616 length:1911 start_codon:yes stop_codon:yes gene_type:complete